MMYRMMIFLLLFMGYGCKSKFITEGSYELKNKNRKDESLVMFTFYEKDSLFCFTRTQSMINDKICGHYTINNGRLFFHIESKETLLTNRITKIQQNIDKEPFIHLSVKNSFGEALPNVKYIAFEGEQKINGVSDSEGKIKVSKSSYKIEFLQGFDYDNYKNFEINFQGDDYLFDYDIYFALHIEEYITFPYSLKAKIGKKKIILDNQKFLLRGRKNNN